MDCHSSLSSAKSGIVRKSKNRRRTVEGFQIFLLPLRFLILVIINTFLQWILPETPYTCGDMVSNRPSGYPGCLLACSFFRRFFLFTQPMGTSWDMVGNGPNGSPLLLSLSPKCFHLSASLALKVSYTHWAFPKGSPTPISVGGHRYQTLYHRYPIYNIIHSDIELNFFIG